MLFEEYQRTDNRIAQASESKFEFYNRSAWPECVQIRHELNSWFAQYPPEEAISFEKRFSCGDDTEFDSAFFEMYLYRFLVQHGYEITIHPPLPSTDKQPDFLVAIERGSFYLEAVLGTQLTKDELAVANIKNRVIEQINAELKDSKFALSVRWIAGTNRARNPQVKYIVKQLQNWLAKLDQTQFASNKDYDDFYIESNGWELTFRAALLSTDRVVAVESGLEPLEDMNPSVKIINTLNTKSRRYGRLQEPYIIAVNTVWITRRPDIETALFSRQTGSCWLERNKGVSAILIGFVVPSSIASHESDLVLYHNPWASLELPRNTLKITEAVLIGDKVEYFEKEHPRLLFGLEPTWPREPPPIE